MPPEIELRVGLLRSTLEGSLSACDWEVSGVEPYPSYGNFKG